MDLLIFISLVVLGYITGTIAEKKHYKSIISRERAGLRLPAVNFGKGLNRTRPVKDVRLVYGNAVISLDYFKRFLAGLKNIVGGNLTSYESLIDRARREAILRMREQAVGSDVIVNLRIDTSSIGQSANRRKSIGSIEAFAYGTAVTYRKEA